MIHAKDLTLRKLRLPALDLSQGSASVLLGPSGCGKTSLLHLIAGLIPATSGELIVAEQSLIGLDEVARDRFRAQHVALIPQQPMLFAALTAVQNIQLAAQFAGHPMQAVQALAQLEIVGLRNRADNLPSKLSRGEQQRVAIARALALKPKVLLCDEPTANLDDESTALVLDLLRKKSSDLTATLVIATHDKRVLEKFSSVVRFK